MNARRRKRGTSLKAFLSMMLCFILVFSVASTIVTSTVDAKSIRQAIIKDMGGTVTVQSAGGSREYDAYTDMALYQGDVLQVGDGGSYVVLEVKDTKDELTFGEGSEVYISKLAKSDGNISKFKMWAGSMWAKVKELAGADEFEVETPTAVMGVRGTHFFTAVDSKTGETYTAVAAGIVQASTFGTTDGSAPSGNGDGGQGPGPVQLQQSAYIYPSQQISLASRNDTQNLNMVVDTIDMKSLIQNAPPKVIENLVTDKAGIDQENEALLQRLKSGQLSTQQSDLQLTNPNNLQAFQQNVNNVVGNVLLTAQAQNVLDPKTVSTLVNQINNSIQDPNKKLDLTNVPPLNKGAGVDPEVQKQKEADQQAIQDKKAQDDQERQSKQEDERQRLLAQLDELTRRLAELLQQNELAKQEEKKKAQDDAKITPPTKPAEQIPLTPESDTTPPSKPTASTVGDSDTSIKGKTESGATVKLKDSAKKVIKSVTAANDGSFSITIDKQPAGTVLYLTATDGSDNESQESEITVVDNTKPAAPMVNTGITSASTHVTGTAERNSTVTVYKSNTVLGSADTDKTTGAFDVSIPAQPQQSTLLVTAKDAAGNESDPASVLVQAAPVSNQNQMHIEPATTSVNANDKFDLQVKMNNFQPFAGVELQLLFDPNYFESVWDETGTDWNGTILSTDTSTSVVTVKDVNVDNKPMKVLIYSVVNTNGSTPLANVDSSKLAGDQLLIKLPFKAKSSGNAAITPILVKVVDSSGNAVTVPSVNSVDVSIAPLPLV